MHLAKKNETFAYGNYNILEKKKKEALELANNPIRKLTT